MGTLVFLAILVAQVQVPAQAVAPSSSVLDVCDIVTRDPTPLNGKLVTVRGRLAGNGEGLWMIGECKGHLVTRGLTWGSDIAVSMDGSEGPTRSWNKMLEKLKDLHADMSRDRILVTVRGRVETRESLSAEVVEMPYGWRRAGFGHMGDSVAQIDLISVEDVVVELGASNSAR